MIGSGRVLGGDGDVTDEERQRAVHVIQKKTLRERGPRSRKKQV